MKPGRVHTVITDRLGGVSAAPYDSRNLGGAVGDDPEAVRRNREKTALEFGADPARVVYMRQVHSADVAYVTAPFGDEPPALDAVFTDEPGLALCVLVADCTPVLIADADAGLVGAAHSGRGRHRPRRRARAGPRDDRPRRGSRPDERADRPVRLRALLRGLRRAARPGLRGAAGVVVHDAPGHPGPRPAGLHHRPARRRGGHRDPPRRPLHHRDPRAVLLPPRPYDGPLRFYYIRLDG